MTHEEARQIAKAKKIGKFLLGFFLLGSACLYILGWVGAGAAQHIAKQRAQQVQALEKSLAAQHK
jgi:hypothetical protein